MLGLPPEQLTTESGAVVSRLDGRNVPYSRLVGGKNFSLKLDAKARLKDPKTYTIVGKPVARVDIPAKVAGTFIFMHDFRVPEMLHARVIRPPTMRGRLTSLDDTAARKIPGYVSTVRKNDRVGDLIENWGDDLEELAPLEITLRLAGRDDATVPVTLESNVTEIGTLELWCVARDRSQRWKLELNIRERDDD